MKKRINLIFILVLTLVMVMCLVACNQHTDTNKLPDNIGDDTFDTTGLTTSLKFTFPVEMSSVFNSINIANFVLSDYVKYSIVYTDSEGKVVKETLVGGVTESMVHEEDRPLLSKPGHHNIRVTAKVDEEKTVLGIFELHLTDSSGALVPVTFTFKLNDTNGGGQAYPYFATNVDTNRGIATKTLQTGTVINSWDEFLSMFTMGLSGKALESAMSGSLTLSATSGFPFTVTANQEFSLAWTDDIIHVKYDLNVPDGAKRDETKAPQDPADLFVGNGEYANVTAQANVGRAIKPEDSKINVYYGYYFAGWFNKANDRLWRFSDAVGSEDIELYAQWVSADYSFTIYTMGGQFASNIHASEHTNPINGNKVTLTESNAENNGYVIINSESRFTLSGSALNRVVFTGFHYGVSYDKYVANVTINADGEQAMLKFSEFYRPYKTGQTAAAEQDAKAEQTAKAEQIIFIKGDGDYLVLDDLYSNYECTQKLDRTDSNVNAAQPVTYIKWLFNAPDSKQDPDGKIFAARISKYYTELLFKDGYTELADGSIRLDQIADWTVNEIIIPEKLTLGNIEHPVTVIGDRALSNAKALTLVDMTNASALTTIGVEAFAYDSALTDIKMPTNNAIANIGDNAFKGTNYEMNYKTINKGAEFIVIGNMIYKYVGEDRKAVDLSNPSTYYNQSNSPNMSETDRGRFNRQLAAVTSIEDGAFANCPSLETLGLSATVTTIRNNALSNLKNFKTLNIPASGSGLVNIGETAFDNTPFLSANGNLYDANVKAIIIGKVFYRYLAKADTNMTLPATHKGYTITHIASKAFAECSNLAEINFEKQENIISIGAEAFVDTRYVRTQKTAFTVVNGILVNYYGPTQDANAMNLVVPKDATTIGSYAFGKQAAYFRTLEINENVAAIENYAFAGAISLTSIIFPNVSVSNGVLHNIPAIDEYAFAGSNGQILDDLVLYFSEEVIKFLKNDKSTSKDPITQSWLNFCRLNAEHFDEEKIDTVVVNTKLIATNYMRKTKGSALSSVFTDMYKAPVEEALIITNNSGIQRTASFSWSGNGDTIIPVTKDGEYKSLWQEGVNKYVVKYKYNGKDAGCAIKADDSNLFVITINDAINGVPAFYTSANYTANNEKRLEANDYLKEGGNFWFEGLNGQVEGAKTPIYYTSFDGFEIVFVYKDIEGNEHRMPISEASISGLNTADISDNKSAIIKVDFYGLGTYEFIYYYEVQRSRYVDIEQTGAITIPVNGNATEYFGKYSIDFIGQDGSRTPSPLTASTFNVLKVDGVTTRVVNTSTLGMHSLEIEYTQALALKRLTTTLYYTVVVEADETQFEYRVFNERYKTAQIIGCKAPLNSTTLVLPSRCTIDGQEYTIAQIGFVQGTSAGVFEKYQNLSSVYLPETIQNIGVNTFRGCSRLERIYTAMQAVSTIVDIPMDDKHFAKVGDAYDEYDEKNTKWTVQPVKLISLDEITTRVNNEIIVGKDYVDNDKKLIYRIVALGDIKLANAEFDKIDVYLPDSIYSAVNITDKANKAIIPIFYASGSNFMIKAVNNAPEGLENIATGAFSGCSRLESIDLTKSTKLELIGGRAFAESGLKSIDLSKNILLEDINNQVFENCHALSSVTLHSNIRHIGTSAFSYCIALTQIDGLTKLGDQDTESLLESIDETAFNQCRSLTRIDIYKNVKAIGANAFSACGALTIYCHMASTNFGNNWNGTNCPVVWNCETNEVADDGNIYVILDNIRYALNTQTKQATVAGQMYVLSGTVVIPSEISYEGETYKVKTIGQKAFENNVNIENIIVSPSLETIEPNAFAGCTGLMTFTINGKNGLKSVASTAFTGCTNLVKIPQVETGAADDNN